MLRRAPGVKDGNLVHAGNRAVRRAAFFREVFAADVVAGVGFERNAGIAALLRAVVHQAVFADVEIARAGAAAPVVRLALRNVVLESVDAREAALFHGLHLVIDAALFFAERLQLAAAIVDDSDRRTEAQLDRALADGERVLRMRMPPPTTELMFT